ncbi:LytR C-terminal domain-containing protein [Candidatus Curtissbacteria bacterium]|nr:LytR C-terminal domain-containing protein [Candidatus Curtissbacteria bacterium]
MAAKKSKTVKKVTEIPNASVTIEVEEKEEDTAGEEAVEDSPVEAKPEETQTTEEKLDDSDSSGGISWKRIFLIVLIVVPIGFLMFGGFLFFSKNFNTDFLKKEPEKTIKLPETSPTPTIEEVNKEAYEIEVQNGSGIAGEGARVKELLEKAGFSVSTVGNAQNSNYTETIITVSEEVEEGFIDELTETLEGRGAVGKIEKFAEGEDGEVLVIVGSDLKEEPTPEE